MGGPALLPSALPPPKQKRSFPWSSPVLPVPKPARAIPRRRGQDPFADIVAGVQEVIRNISRGMASALTQLHIVSSFVQPDVL